MADEKDVVARLNIRVGELRLFSDERVFSAYSACIQRSRSASDFGPDGSQAQD